MATMLVTLTEMKDRLGIADASQDDFLTEQLQIVSETIEAYCNRKFLTATYVQDFYEDLYTEYASRESLLLACYPVQSITSIKEIYQEESGDTENLLASVKYRLHKPTGKIYRLESMVKDRWFSNYNTHNLVQVEFVAGVDQANLPLPLKEVVYSIVTERYNKYAAGIDVNFGPGVQRVSIPGVMSLDFDYSLDSNKRENKFGAIIGDHANVLDFYRSDSGVMPIIREVYVS